MWLSAGMWQMLLDGWTCMFSCIAGEQCPSPEQCPRARIRAWALLLMSCRETLRRRYIEHT